MKNTYVTCDQCKHRVTLGEQPPGIRWHGRYCMNDNLLDHIELGSTSTEEALRTKANVGIGWWFPTQACRDIKGLCGADAKWFEPKETS